MVAGSSEFFTESQSGMEDASCHSENIQVVLRLCPLPAEIVPSLGIAGTLSWAERRLDLPDGIYCRFTEVFGEDEPVEKVFQSALQPLVDGILDGYNAAFFTWGAPKTGKTASVFGDALADASFGESTSYGFAHLAIQRLFHKLKEISSEGCTVRSSIRATAVELGGLEVVDLLNLCDNGELGCSRCPAAEGSTAVEAASAEELLQILTHARAQHRRRRHSLPEGLNRRHCIFTIHCKLEQEDAFELKCFDAHLSIIDLAGAAEGAEQTRASSAYGLADVSRVIEALAKRRDTTPISYDASPLSQMMQGALGGNCRTVMLLTAVGSAEALKAEVFVPQSSLQVAANAAEVVNFPHQNCSTVRVASPELAQPNETQGETLPKADSVRKDVRSTGLVLASPHKLQSKDQRAEAKALLSFVADDSVFDMSVDSEGGIPNHNSLLLPLVSPTSPLAAAVGEAALSPILTQAFSPTVQNGSPRAKPPPIPRVDTASRGSSILKEVLQQKLAELTTASSQVSSSSDAAKSCPARLVSEADSETTLTPTPGNTSTKEVFASTEVSNPHDGNTALNDARQDFSPHAQQQTTERLAKTRQLLEKRTILLTKTQLQLEEANLCASQWEAVAERLNQKVAEQATTILALERLLGLLLSQRGPEILEDISKLDPESLSALRNFVSMPASGCRTGLPGSAVEQESKDDGDQVEKATPEDPEKLTAEMEKVGAETPLKTSTLPRPSAAVSRSEASCGDVERFPQLPLFGKLSDVLEEDSQDVEIRSEPTPSEPLQPEDVENNAQRQPALQPSNAALTDPPLPANFSTSPYAEMSPRDLSRSFGRRVVAAWQSLVLPAPVHHVAGTSPRSPVHPMVTSSPRSARSSQARLTPQSSPAKSPPHNIRGSTVTVQPAETASGKSTITAPPGDLQSCASPTLGGCVWIEPIEPSVQDDNPCQPHLQTPLSKVSSLPQGSSDGSHFFSAVWYGRDRSSGSPRSRSPDSPGSLDKGSYQLPSPTRLQSLLKIPETHGDALLKTSLGDHHAQQATTLGVRTPACSSFHQVIPSKLESARTTPRSSRVELTRSCKSSTATLDSIPSAKTALDIPRGVIRVYKPLEQRSVGGSATLSEPSSTATPPPPPRTPPIASRANSPAPGSAVQSNVLRINLGPVRDVSRGRVLEPTCAQRGIGSARSVEHRNGAPHARSVTPVRESFCAPGVPHFYNLHGEAILASSCARSPSPPVDRHGKPISRRVLQTNGVGTTVPSGRLTPPPRSRFTPPGPILAPPVRISTGIGTPPSLPPNHAIGFVGHIPGQPRRQP